MTTKQKGHFPLALAMDTETTGLCFKSDSPVYNPRTGERHQTVSWGFIVTDTETFLPKEELYVEIKWNESSIKQREENPNFGKKAEEVHGLTKEYLDSNGVTEEEAIVQIGNLIIRNWGPESSIVSLGHNVGTFDLPFIRDLMSRYDVPLTFGGRNIDSFSVGLATIKSFTSDALFDTMGVIEHRGKHNALDDAKFALESVRRINTIWNSKVGLLVEE